MVRRLENGEEAIWRNLLIESVETHPECFVTTAEKMRAIPLSWFEHEIEQQFVLTAGADEAFAVLELDGKGARLHSMYVQPHARRRGLAGEIIRHICTLAHQKGIERVELGVLQDNVKAVTLYEKHGFKIEKSEPFGERIDCKMAIYLNGS